MLTKPNPNPNRNPDTVFILAPVDVWEIVTEGGPKYQAWMAEGRVLGEGIVTFCVLALNSGVWQLIHFVAGVGMCDVASISGGRHL